MHPEQIKAAIRMNGTTAAVIAEQLGISASTVSQVISGRGVSARVAERIAEVTGLKVDVLWPSSKNCSLRRPTKTVISQNILASQKTAVAA